MQRTAQAGSKYVHAYPSLAGPWQVSTQGGVQPRWRTDGRAMYYLDHKADVVSPCSPLK